jgi:hypothetical protein
VNVSGAAWRVVVGSLFAPDENQRNEAVAQLLRDNDEQFWPQIIWLADTNFVTPALWAALERKHLKSLVPANAAQYLRALYEMNEQRNAAIDLQLAEILHTLNAAGIVPCLLKGAAHLRAGVYADPALRILTDLDLLLPTDRLLDAQRLLSGIGYDASADVDWDFSAHHHVPPLVRKGAYASVEVHQEPLYVEAQRCLSAEELWNAAVMHADAGAHYAVPAPTHAELLLFLHSEVVDRNLRRWFVSLRTFQDLMALAAAHGESIDWAGICALLKRHGHYGAFRNFMYIADRLAGFRPVPLGFGAVPRLKYLGCRFVLGHGAIRPWLRRADALSSRRLREQHGEQPFAARSRHRVRVIAASLSRGLRRARGRGGDG